MFLPINIAIASLATAGMMHAPGIAPLPRHTIPTPPPSIERVEAPFAPVKQNMLSHIDRALSHIETRTAQVNDDEKLSDEQRQKRLERLTERTERMNTMRSGVESANSFDDLKALHRENIPSHQERHKARREIREDMQEIRRDRRELRRDVRELRHDIREQRAEQK
ncbi:MAG: hypothetical protein UY72_C0002G0011 [Candidatus Uhrbacteria bacterium GW2011_GWD2_52_7]|uniref:Uncharacterized protein n=1 Tax=Candidatus Uhrbacteria bacterium GW2011_GWD2_52_7 TaxID=1618989 RepID=A0A0G1XIQ5_9BACT|nr:MAG: hypothetical protein UY72_C0002G0011 [Candidatus Uhrbacteria bacterium GW2011_GWD2_52_7]